MSVDIRFSKSAFVEEYNRDPASTRLSEALEIEVQRELHTVLLPKMLEIVARLNTMGHQLGEYLPPVPGYISFRDDVGKNGSYRCFLRVDMDAIVSAGFGDATNAEDEEGNESDNE